jgi:hypothetical protein
MKKRYAVLLGAGLGVLGTWQMPQLLDAPVEEPPAQIHRLQLLAELVTLELKTVDILVHENWGYTGGIRCIVVCRGEARLGIDLEKAHYQDVDKSSRTAALMLPQPQVISASLNQRQTEVYRIDHQYLWRVWPGHTTSQLINEAMARAQARVREAAKADALQARARRQAGRRLRTLFKTIGWEVTLRWREPKAK